MNRSKKFVFVPFCFFAQGIRAEGIVKDYPSIIYPLVDILASENINIIQMPCCEIEYEGIKRNTSGKKKYDNKEYREICKKRAKEVVNLMQKLLSNNFEILLVLGIENSPSCAVNYIFEGIMKKESGIFIEDLKKEMNRQKITVPILGINTRGMKVTIKRIREAINKEKGLFD